MAISARPAPAVERRGILMATLFAAQVCGSTGHSMSMAVGGIGLNKGYYDSKRDGVSPAAYNFEALMERFTRGEPD